MGMHGMNDAIHGMMEVDDQWKKQIKSIIDLPDFQRLRHIKQLGLADLVFPGAVHTRFSHCVGTAYLAYRITRKLKIGGRDQKALVLALGRVEEAIRRKNSKISWFSYTRNLYVSEMAMATL